MILARHAKQQIPFLWALPVSEIERLYRDLKKVLDLEKPKDS